MVKIAPFAVEQVTKPLSSQGPTLEIEAITNRSQWMDEYETKAKYNIAETCAASISLEDLASFDEQKRSPLSVTGKLTYGAIRGSERLRSNLARLYSANAPSPLSPDDVLITNGAIAANFLVLYTLVGPGDHVICHYPTYQQLYAVPASLGADVSLWKAREEEGWRLDVDELKALIKPNTKLIIIKYAPSGHPPP